MIKLQDARIADGLPRVVAEQPWAKVLSAVYGELQGRMLEYLATGMTFSDVDNCSEGMLDQMAIYLKIEWYDSAADIETKRKLVRTAIEIQRYAGTVKAVREQVETIYKKPELRNGSRMGGHRDSGNCMLTSPTIRKHITPQQKWKSCWATQNAALLTLSTSSTSSNRMNGRPLISPPHPAAWRHPAP